MLRGTAGLTIALHELQRLRNEAARMAGETEFPAARLRVEQTLAQLDGTIRFLLGALSHAEVRRDVEELYDLPCEVTLFDVKVTA